MSRDWFKPPEAKTNAVAVDERGRTMIRRKVSLIIFLALALMGASSSPRSAEATLDQKEAQQAAAPKIKVSIATANPMLEGTTNTYRFGEQIPVEIKLTNTAATPVYSCLSDDLYQDLPELKRNGKIVPYTNWQSYMVKWAERNQTCLTYDLPDRTLLLPNTPTLVDSLMVVDDNSDPMGALAWYDELPPGKYELSVKRHLGCCDGPMLESNTINFEITP
jgi:hypothetical protein